MTYYHGGQGVLQDYKQALMWFNIAAANGQGGAAFNRDKIAAKISPADVTKAQEMAKDWLAKHPKKD